MKQIDLVELVPKPSARVKPKVSRSKPQVERWVVTVTAYTKNDRGMNGRGVTASGEPVQEGRTIAAPESIPFGTQIHIPGLGNYTVTDRGGAITEDKLDLYMESREDALQFGAQEFEVLIKYQ
ncbi:3D domain-containing protein [Desulfosporosinus youngiae]|uniref:3D domain-containing protein n=1 Tax=Desulfosporosinus youngiae TaxID=339862 RepID=UPI001FA816C2|nr:3D domain-containing protein [Desulfosporosinus youngiae]